MDATDLLRPGLLEGTTVAVTDAAGGEGPRALGATTPALAVAFPLDDDALAAAAAQLGGVDVLVCDGRPLFADAGGGLAGLRAAADGCFAAAPARADAPLIPARRGEGVPAPP